MPTVTNRSGWVSWLALGLALVGLNLALSFHNLWPTLWVTTRHELSVEIAFLVLIVAVLCAIGKPPSQRLVSGAALVLLAFVLGRYMEVTAPSLYGRRINLYWDAQHLPRVAAMLAEALPTWQVLLLATLLLLGLMLLYLVCRWLLQALVGAMAETGPRRLALVLSTTLVALYSAGYVGPQISTLRWFSLPVSLTYAQQLGFVRSALAGAATLDSTARPLPSSSLDRLAGADMLVLFFESYGATTLDRPDFAHALDSARSALAQAIEQSGREVVSARVRSPTFGGASWLAHSTFLSGIQVSENDRYQLLLTGERETLVHRFAQQGYRTVGFMPGLRQAWPEGAFYGYDRIYDASALRYPGPAFGWWRIPDQYALAQVNAMELTPGARQPVLAVMNSITSHAPFHPVPPYQPDWQTLLGPEPFKTDTVAQQIDPSEAMADDYVKAIDYVLTSVAGYLGQRGPDELVLIVIGDHQPAARVTGPDASWDVPVHVIARNPPLMDALSAQGFVTGLTPGSDTLGPMHTLAGRLLQAFDSAARDDTTSKRTDRSIAAQRQPGIDVAGTIVGRQRANKIPGTIPIAPVVQNQSMALAGRPVVTVGAERLETLDTGQSSMGRGGQILE